MPKIAPKTVKIPQEPSQLEALFWLQLRAHGVQEGWEQQAKVIPGRNFRYDFANRSQRILVEIQGGNYRRGAHNSLEGLKRDYEKCNLAQRHGWKIYQFDSAAVREGRAIEWILEEMTE